MDPTLVVVFFVYLVWEWYSYTKEKKEKGPDWAQEKADQLIAASEQKQHVS